MTVSGDFSEFPIPTPGSFPQGITTGSDGNLWFIEALKEELSRQIGQLVPATGMITEFKGVRSTSGPQGITAGPDGNVWFVNGYDQIGRITPTGTVTAFPILTSRGVPQGIAVGPDGNLWFTEYYGNKVGRINPFGTDEDIRQSVREFTVPTANSFPAGIVAGPDGNLWFTEAGGNKIGRINTAGQFLGEFPVPTTASNPTGIAAGPDGNIWFTEYAPAANKIGKLYVLTPYGNVLDAVAQQRLDGIVAFFHDDEPGMVAANYTPRINWGDGTPETTGQAWYYGFGWWVVTGSHTYADSGFYTTSVSVADSHPCRPPQMGTCGMTSSTVGYIDVAAGFAPDGGHAPHALAPDAVAVLLRAAPVVASPRAPASASPDLPVAVPAPPLRLPGEAVPTVAALDAVAPLLAATRHAAGGWDAELVDALAVNFLAG